MNFFVVAAFGGPVVGPIAGSFLAQEEGYRWLFWLCLIFSGVCFLAGASPLRPRISAQVLVNSRLTNYHVPQALLFLRPLRPSSWSTELIGF